MLSLPIANGISFHNHQYFCYHCGKKLDWQWNEIIEKRQQVETQKRDVPVQTVETNTQHTLCFHYEQLRYWVLQSSIFLLLLWQKIGFAME